MKQTILSLPIKNTRPVDAGCFFSKVWMKFLTYKSKIVLIPKVFDLQGENY